MKGIPIEKVLTATPNCFMQIYILVFVPIFNTNIVYLQVVCRKKPCRAVCFSWSVLDFSTECLCLVDLERSNRNTFEYVDLAAKAQPASSLSLERVLELGPASLLAKVL